MLLWSSSMSRVEARVTGQRAKGATASAPPFKPWGACSACHLARRCESSSHALAMCACFPHGGGPLPQYGPAPPMAAPLYSQAPSVPRTIMRWGHWGHKREGDHSYLSHRVSPFKLQTAPTTSQPRTSEPYLGLCRAIDCCQNIFNVAGFGRIGHNHHVDA